MKYTAQAQWGPDQTPKPLRNLIIITCLISIITALINPLFIKLGWNGPLQFLSLSWYGIRHYFLWQPLTYLFAHESTSSGITTSYLITLLFNMYLLWTLGSTVLERVGNASFFKFYFVCGVLTGLTTLLFMPLLGQYSTLFGPTASLLGLFIVWTMFYPENELLLFFVFPIKAKWLLAAVLGAVVLIAISQLDLIDLTFYLSATIYAYLYGVIAWDLRGPFAWSYRFDSAITSMANQMRYKTTILFRKSARTPGTQSKIIDFTTGESIMDDDTFIDTMLSKISKDGEKALTSSERRKMQKISERKMKEKSSLDK